MKLIKIYSIICDRFEKDLKHNCERFSNNNKQDITDQEIMTIYLFTVQEEQRFSVKQIHKYTCDYLIDCFTNQSLLDSMPIINCSGKRSGKVTKDLTDKGYCSTISLYYYGVKLHVLAFRRLNTIHFPEEIHNTCIGK